MATRARKTRRLRGSRTHGWGQVGQHRASGHKGGLGASGQLKHHFSSMLKYNPGHFGHDSTRPPPRPGAPRGRAGVRDLDALYARIGSEEGGARVIDLAANGYGKLLGGGSVSGAYTVRATGSTEAAAKKVEAAGGRVEAPAGRAAGGG